MAQTGGRRGESRESYWGRMVAEWSVSGQTQVAFCRRRGLAVASLRWWKSKLARRGRSEAANFVQVPVVSNTSLPQGLFEVVLANGRVLRVPTDAEVDSVARLASALEGWPC